MEFLVILATLVAASLGRPIVKTWTLNELSTVIEKQSNEAMQPYLEDALNQIMYAIFTGTNHQDIHALILSPTGDKKWTNAQLTNAIRDPETNPSLQPFIVSALQSLNYMHADGKHQDSVAVSIPALDISVWTISDVQEAKDDPNTKPALQPFLKKAEDKIREALIEGVKKENVRVTLVTPVGLVPVKSGSALEIIRRSS